MLDPGHTDDWYLNQATRATWATFFHEQDGMVVPPVLVAWSKAGILFTYFTYRPTSLDAVVYGHLYPLLKAPLGSSPLHTHLKACRNLVMYCQRISNEYFPLSPEGSISVHCIFTCC